MPEWMQSIFTMLGAALKWIFGEIIEIPVKLLQVVVAVFPTSDHYRFNLIADLLAMLAALLLCLKVNIPIKDRMWVLGSIPLLFVFFAWCFRTSLITRRR